MSHQNLLSVVVYSIRVAETKQNSDSSVVPLSTRVSTINIEIKSKVSKMGGGSPLKFNTFGGDRKVRGYTRANQKDTRNKSNLPNTVSTGLETNF